MSSPAFVLEFLAGFGLVCLLDLFRRAFVAWRRDPARHHRRRRRAIEPWRR